MAVEILGIRHHGVGSAEMVKARLEELKPDIVLVEGPPEITDLLQLIGNEELQPPVAVIVYDENNLERYSFYPFADYSPEWVACTYANKHKIPIKALDLPAKLSYYIQDTQAQASKTKENGDKPREDVLHRDPISFLAEIAGYPSGESWWDEQFEHINSRQPAEHFDGVALAMHTLREEGITSSLDEENVLREAYMRLIIRETINEMYQNIVVVCGAWHGPKLHNLKEKEKEDNILIKQLPNSKLKIKSAWIPWTNRRLSRFSGYGAGITSPGWYEHRWTTKQDLELSWLSKVATLFRSENIDISTAHVMEAYRLAHSLANLRDHSVISYQDLHDAVKTVMCNGETVLLDLIKKHLLIDEKIGKLPSNIPKVPLQHDFESQIKALRLKLSAMPKMFNLDLRKPLHLKRSILFHRLNILEITWAERKTVRTKGSFKEGWELTWDPTMEVLLIDKSSYGNTIEIATHGVIRHKLDHHTEITDFVSLINNCIPAQLFSAMDEVLTKISQLASIARDTKDILRSLPELINISRYGDVRQTDVAQINHIIQRLFNKVTASLTNTCYGLDEESSNEMINLIGSVDRSLKLITDQEINHRWIQTLNEIKESDGVHMVIKGCTIRLLFDKGKIEEETLSDILSYYLSLGNNASDVAFWIEGFLRGSGLILIYDNRIWNLIYQWVSGVESGTFIQLLPVLRRAFSRFPFGERRQIGEKAKQGITLLSTKLPRKKQIQLNHERGLAMLPYVQKFLIGRT